MGNPTTEHYRELYRLLETETPLRFDCGRLCRAACCQVSPELPGMFLFPGEEALFESLTGFTLSVAELPGYGGVRLLSCEGACDRLQQPLSCRVFPLAPLVRGESVSIRLDPRGRAVCPLCLQSESGLSLGFRAAVTEAFCLLWKTKAGKAFLAALSAHLDDFSKPL